MREPPRGPARADAIIPVEGSLPATANTPASQMDPIQDGIDCSPEPGQFTFDQTRADQINPTDALRLLEALRHPGERMWLQIFADGPDSAYAYEEAAVKGRKPRKIWRLTGVPKPLGTGIHGYATGGTERTGWVTPDELRQRPYLLENMARCGVFFCVNALPADAKRRNAPDISRVAALLLDLDGAPLPATFPVPPTAIVESSPGRFHVYWAVDGIPLNEFTTLQKALAAIYGGDPSISDLPRVMRLPGYWHSKGKPHLVTLRELNPNAHYTRDDVVRVWPQLADAVLAAEQTQEQEKRATEARQKRAKALRDQPAQGGNYGLATLQRLEADMLSAQPGKRNVTLNWVAYRAGQMVGAGLLDEDEARTRLTQAAEQTGLASREIDTTFNNGIVAGKAKPADTREIGTRAKAGREIDTTLNKAIVDGKAKPADATEIGTRAKAGGEDTPPPVATGQPGNAPKAAEQAYIMPRLSKGTHQATDEANALILAANLGGRLRYTIGLGWLVYQQHRGVWVIDAERVHAAEEAGKVLRRVVSQVYDQAVEKRADEVELRRITRWAASVGSNRTVQSALQGATGKEAFLTPFKDWDAQPHLLNCRNGTLDLITGALRPHDPNTLLTWRAGAHYDPEARHPHVDQLLALLRADGREGFLQRSVGSALYGEAPNEVLTVLDGKGGTGKGTLVAGVTAMLGDYATTIEVQLLLSNPRGESAAGPRPELLALRGRRLVIAGEPPKGASFNAGRVKGMTGNDPITARNMHSPTMVTFKPVFKLWIHTNYPIGASHDDSGLQRRLRVVPFKARPQRADPTVKKTLESDPVARSALLNWALEGCRAWLTSGYDLGESEVITQATGAYWHGQNPYEQFVATQLDLDPRSELPSGRLKALFEDWAAEKGDEVKRNVKLADLHGYLRQQGCTAVKGAKGARKWVGVRERA
ncbi:phage/plasmid primase, P4 family [Deinococcus humi]|uniref:P4 family phage/plasmid primase-like protein n=1 Tax=Deinococcus humi TaxID=662880 RepID=A0A7W8JX36_9DEIO|nr:phage/plasmid primase, P4 family [Deinococcus humi]MBB5364837.1 P4 family phage/plasmid primase-like protein [Deinococcus humi]GGO33948.1 hypothetical protein GCM10008949_33990 [Deinococcus humi]